MPILFFLLKWTEVNSFFLDWIINILFVKVSIFFPASENDYGIFLIILGAFAKLRKRI
jgi:hypothetical protein